ncbi:hypothetical protein KDW_48870 [Dictyobacter vulcani]|uniref:Uncharacterized protein n=1 Tax=Dictyobacter vulcani TaxID=2607529 RepID=A0A5J4KS42_9CHLR|nr:DUF6114 domain-containing protein [Dictyobacter vulcani]GER90725.1 hypothetical protein KDW_48870 [Dictyobacter vulcani]
MATATRRTTHRSRKKKSSGSAVTADIRSHATTVEVAEQPEKLLLAPAATSVPVADFPSCRRLWLQQRPVVGSCLIVLAGILVLWGPLALMQFAFLPGNTVWAGLLVGSMLCVLGLLQLFFPAYALLTGILAIICALASLMAAAGGFGIGMIFGIIGGAQGVAWRNLTLSRTEYQLLLARPSRQKRCWHLRKYQATSSR